MAFFHRALDPAESLAEILFGLIMVLRWRRRFRACARIEWI
jgi:hypothetical protein